MSSNNSLASYLAEMKELTANINVNESLRHAFGRFDWNISAASSMEMEYDMIWVNLVGVLFEVTVIVFFLVKFCIKKSGFREPYYIIYTMVCIVDAMPKILNFLFTYFIKHPVVGGLSSAFRFYNSNYMTLWIFILALNRFSAIFFSLQFSRIWSKRNTTIVCIFLSLYPFIIHCFNPEFVFCQMIGTYYCYVALRLSPRQTDFEYYYGYISDITFSVLSAVLCLASACNIVITKRMKNQNVEKVLLIQSFTSSVFLILSTATGWLGSVNGDVREVTYRPELERAQNLQRFLSVLSGLFYNLHHYIGLLLLIAMSRHFRKNYLEFYKITILFKWCTRNTKPKSDATNTVVVVPPTSTITSPRLTHTISTFLR